MAASICSNVLQKLCKTTGIVHQNNMNHIIFRCKTCLTTLPLTQSVRQCSQFAEKAAQMDGNTYRLKNDVDDRVYVREGENPEAEEERRPRRAPYVENQERRFKTRAHKAKLYQWQGKASGIDPSIMWPTRRELEKLQEYENEWCPSLQEMQKEIEEEKRIQRLEELRKEKIIAANMAKMPQMMKEFDDKLEDQKRQGDEKKIKRAKLLEEARVKLGYNVDPRSHHFKVMLEEMEAEEKKRKKALKKKERMNKFGTGTGRREKEEQ